MTLSTDAFASARRKKYTLGVSSTDRDETVKKEDEVRKADERERRQIRSPSFSWRMLILSYLRGLVISLPQRIRVSPLPLSHLLHLLVVRHARLKNVEFNPLRSVLRDTLRTDSKPVFSASISSRRHLLNEIDHPQCSSMIWTACQYFQYSSRYSRVSKGAVRGFPLSNPPTRFTMVAKA